MSKLLDTFWADAKKVALTADEKAAVYASIKVGVPSISGAGSILTSAEKDLGRQALLQFARNYEAPKKWWHTQLWVRSLSFAMALVIIVSAGGGAVYAAEDSVPGDALYAVKVNVTEPILDKVHRSPERKAEWATRKYERRMRELQVLSGRRGAPSATIEEALTRMATHSTQMQARIDALPEGEMESKLRERLEQKLAAHEEFFNQVQTGAITLDQLKKIRSEVRQRRENVRRERRERRQMRGVNRRYQLENLAQ